MDGGTAISVFAIFNESTSKVVHPMISAFLKVFIRPVQCINTLVQLHNCLPFKGAGSKDRTSCHGDILEQLGLSTESQSVLSFLPFSNRESSYLADKWLYFPEYRMSNSLVPR